MRRISVEKLKKQVPDFNDPKVLVNFATKGQKALEKANKKIDLLRRNSRAHMFDRVV